MIKEYICLAFSIFLPKNFIGLPAHKLILTICSLFGFLNKGNFDHNSCFSFNKSNTFLVILLFILFFYHIPLVLLPQYFQLGNSFDELLVTK
jgi:hypothetical protein